MGGVASTIGKVGGAIGQGVGDVLTLGTDRIKGSPTAMIGKGLSTIVTGGTNQWGGSGNGGSSGYTPQQVPNVGNDPMSVLVSTGGAPLLAQISMGVDPDEALASYFGQSSQNWNDWLNQQDDQTRNEIQGLHETLTQVQKQTSTQQATISKLVSDFPNFMSSMVPKYASIMTDATKSMMDQAIQSSAAKYAAGGQVSSGAMNEAEAKIGAQYGADAVNYGTSLASSDWANQYTEANALRSFQQKMLGQGASQGFSAAQAALNRSQEVSGTNVAANNQASAADAAASNNLTSSLLGLGGTIGAAYLTGGKSLIPSAASGSTPGAGTSIGYDPSIGALSTPTAGTPNANPANYGIGGGYR